MAVATYNGERFIAEQLGSILAQDPPPSEIVVSDDGSRDRTVELVRSIAATAPASVPVSVLDRGNLGISKNFERAVTACTGDVVVLCDQDDRWHDGRLAALVSALEADPGLALVHTDARLVDEDGRPLGATLLQALEYSDAERDDEASGRAFSVLLRRNVVTGATAAFRRSLLEFALPFPEEWVHDEWLALIAAATAEIRLLDEPTVDYRQHGANQIGVTVPTLRYKIRRVLESRGDRNRLLARKFAVLADRLEQLGDAVPADRVRSAHLKARFEGFRAELPRSRWRRIRPVVSAARAGLYGRFASQGRADMIRDVLQAA